MPVATDPGVQQMPSIAADPADPKHLVTAYMDYSLLKTGYAGIGVKVSYNGGSTWSQETSIALPAGFDQGAAYPMAQFDGQGHAFVSFMAATMLGPQTALTDARSTNLVLQSNNGIFVARSDDGGTTWNAPVAVVSHLYDGKDKVDFEMQPAFAIDTFRTLPDGQPNPYYGSLYETWGRDYPAGQFPGEPTATGGRDIMFAVSRDHGQTWQIQLQPQVDTGIPISVIHPYDDTSQGSSEGAGILLPGRVAVGPEGDIYVSYAAANGLAISHSTDGGASFASPDGTTGAYAPFGYGIQGTGGLYVGPPTLPGHYSLPQADLHLIAVDPIAAWYGLRRGSIQPC